MLEYPNDPKTWDDTTKYEFLAGKEFLVAPMWGADEVKSGIYLPEGRWVDYWTGKVYQGPTTVNGYHAELDTLPLFVKAGAVVPMWKTGINAAAEQGFGDRLTVDIYPQGKSSFTLYEDDRVTRATSRPSRPQQTVRGRRTDRRPWRRHRQDRRAATARTPVSRPRVRTS